MNRNEIWLPLIASIGVGAATFYSMSKNNSNNNQDIGQAIQQFMPGSSGGQNTSSNSDNNSGVQGPFGMS